MTFRPDPSDVKLCNRALSLLSQTPITSLDPPAPAGVASRECALHYKPTVARLLELHHWGLARKRGTLTAVTNDRTGEWTGAYQLPADCAFPVIFSTYAGSGGTSMTYYRALGGLVGAWRGRPLFHRVGSILYTNVSAELDYVSYDISEAEFNSTFENIVVLTLAATMAFAITKRQQREETLRQQATSAINIAIAQDLNQGQQRYGDTPSERDFARGADMPVPWDWWPGIPA